MSDATPTQTSSELLLSTCCFGIAVPLSVFFWKDKPYWKGPSKLALLSQGQGTIGRLSTLPLRGFSPSLLRAEKPAGPHQPHVGRS